MDIIKLTQDKDTWPTHNQLCWVYWTNGGAFETCKFIFDEKALKFRTLFTTPSDEYTGNEIFYLNEPLEYSMTIFEGWLPAFRLYTQENIDIQEEIIFYRST